MSIAFAHTEKPNFLAMSLVGSLRDVPHERHPAIGRLRARTKAMTKRFELVAGLTPQVDWYADSDDDEMPAAGAVRTAGAMRSMHELELEISSGLGLRRLLRDADRYAPDLSDALRRASSDALTVVREVLGFAAIVMEEEHGPEVDREIDLPAIEHKPGLSVAYNW